MAERITCTRRLEFDAAHRVMKHEGKCRHLHGHRYAVEATFEAPALDTLGRVIDFGIIKEKLGTWLDANWDHTTILCDEDKALADAISNVTKQNIFLLPCNPTAERMAHYLLTAVCPKLFSGQPLRCIRIRVHETPSCHADCIAE